MKINILDAHDRLLFFQKQADYISMGCLDCINNRPLEFKNYPFYIYAHARTADDGVSKRLIWAPRLTKPWPETNSMLFKYYPANDTIKIIWMIPDPVMWDQYQEGNVTESKIVLESIDNFKHHTRKLRSKEPDDLPDHMIKAIMREIGRNFKLKQANAEALSSAS